MVKKGILGPDHIEDADPCRPNRAEDYSNLAGMSLHADRRDAMVPPGTPLHDLYKVAAVVLEPSRAWLSILQVRWMIMSGD